MPSAVNKEISAHPHTAELKRDPQVREELKRDMSHCIAMVMGIIATSDDLAESILGALEKKGWHGVRE